MAEICHRVKDRFGMSTEWAPIIVVPIFNWKGGIINVSCHRGLKLLEHAMKAVKRVLEKGFV